MIKRKRLTSVLLALVILISLLAALPSQALAQAAYPDVPSNHQFYPYIKYLSGKEILQGYEDGKFKPEKNMTRAEAATVLVRAAGHKVDASAKNTGSFHDTNGHRLEAYIAVAKAKGIFDGEADGRFRPNDYISRGETAKVVCEALAIKLKAGQEKVFTDVKEHIFKPYIDILTSQGILEGVGGGKFKPEDLLNRGQMSKYLANAQIFPVEAIINASPSLRVRPAPNLEKLELGSLANDTKVILLEQVEGQAIYGDTRWYRINYNNQEGYISAYYVKIEKWKPDSPPIDNDLDFEAYLDSQGFPEDYKPALRALHQKYPNWVFTGVKINFDFETAVNGQYKPGSRRSLIQASSDDSWKSHDPRDHVKQEDPDKDENTEQDKNENEEQDKAPDKIEWKHYEPGWVAPNEEIIAYQMDPRNFLAEEHIFMFKSLSFNAKNQTKQETRQRLAGTFMDPNHAYYCYDQNYDFADYFWQAAHASQVSPYHLISRVIIEVSRKGSGATSGNYVYKDEKDKEATDLKGYYNFYNIGAYGGPNPMRNGLVYAKNKGWDSPKKAIIGGASFIGSSYINNKQNTVYFQKFDLPNGANSNHQYMSNILAPQSEASIMYNGYLNQKTLAEAKEFLIPIFTKPIPKTAYPTSSANLFKLNLAAIDPELEIEERLTAAKENKLAEIDTLLDDLRAENYTAESWQALLAAIAKDKAEIDALETVEAVEEYSLTARAAVEALKEIESDADKGDTLLVDAEIDKYQTDQTIMLPADTKQGDLVSSLVKESINQLIKDGESPNQAVNLEITAADHLLKINDAGELIVGTISETSMGTITLTFSKGKVEKSIRFNVMIKK